MSNSVELVEDCLARLRQSPAFDIEMTLIEADHGVVPLLMTAFDKELDPTIRTQLVYIIWQHRLPGSAAFLGKAMGDPEPTVWKEALDGLVSLGSTEALRILKDSWANPPAHQANSNVYREWIAEAINQLHTKE